jgi:hypothetical protein
MQQTCFGSMEMKRDTAQWRDKERRHRREKRDETMSVGLT